MTRALEHGYAVSKPWGDSAAYDVGVSHGPDILRVQVKSTTVRTGTGYFCQFKLEAFCGRERSGSPAAEIPSEVEGPAFQKAGLHSPANRPLRCLRNSAGCLISHSRRRPLAIPVAKNATRMGQPAIHR